MTDKTTKPQRDILFITGTRADFGKLKPLMERVESAQDFNCRVFVTGMHMLARYGSTVREVEKAGFASIHQYINQDGAAPSQMDIVLADTVRGISHYVREFRPDLIVVHGDRIETLAGAIVGALNNILVAHVEGGELSGTVDELIRHAVTKLAHLHFVANEEAKRRLIQMGETESSIYVIGSPDIDVMLFGALPSLQEVLDHYAIPFSDYGILIYHPVTTEIGVLSMRVKEVVDGILGSGLNFVVIYPNNDHGSDIVMLALQCLNKDPSRFRCLPSMRFEAFLTLLQNARVIVGNSSAGIREAPVYGVPTINTGSRQFNRFHHPSIVNLPEDASDITQALGKNLPDRFPRSNHFGDGRSADKFALALEHPSLWAVGPQKQFKDVEGG